MVRGKLSVKLIPLTQGQHALVDDSDYDALIAHNWYAVKVKKTGNYYAARMSTDSNGKRIVIRMHFAIMGQKGIDHRDSNGLNNQRYNLRPASQESNNRNAAKSKRNLTSKYKGVSVRKEYKTIAYRAQITVNYQKIPIGTFAVEVDAAKAYDSEAIKHFGEYAKLNFPIT